MQNSFNSKVLALLFLGLGNNLCGVAFLSDQALTKLATENQDLLNKSNSFYEQNDYNETFCIYLFSATTSLNKEDFNTEIDRFKALQSTTPFYYEEDFINAFIKRGNNGLCPTKV